MGADSIALRERRMVRKNWTKFHNAHKRTVDIFVQLFYIPMGASAQQLYYLHPDVSFFKGNGFKSIGPCE